MVVRCGEVELGEILRVAGLVAVVRGACALALALPARAPARLALMSNTHHPLCYVSRLRAALVLAVVPFDVANGDPSFNRSSTGQSDTGGRMN